MRHILQKVFVCGLAIAWSACFAQQVMMNSPDYGKAKANEVAAIKAMNGKVVRNGKILTLLCGTGSIHRTDKPESWETAIVYTFIGPLVDEKNVVILCSGFEWWSYELIHMSTGKTINLDGEPFASPSNKYAAARSIDLDAHYANNSIAVVDLESVPPKRVFYYKFGEYTGPEYLTWVNDETLRFWLISVDPKSQSVTTKGKPGRLTRVAGKWILHCPGLTSPSTTPASPARTQ